MSCTFVQTILLPEGADEAQATTQRYKKSCQAYRAIGIKRKHLFFYQCNVYLCSRK